MSASGWFILQMGLTVLALLWGLRLGRGRRKRAWLIMGASLGCLGVWIWLMHHPALGLDVFPARVWSYFEGTAAAPIFMLFAGTAYRLAVLPRQRMLITLATGLGVLYFVHGGLWMLQPTPVYAFDQAVRSGTVMQSQDFSCVPAACATALNTLGIYSTEAQMAELTLTRPGTGATVVRALRGLQERLHQSAWRADLRQLTVEQLRCTPGPMVVPLQFEFDKQHMVVIQRWGQDGVDLDDPMLGPVHLASNDFSRCYGGQAIVFQWDNRN